MKHAVIIFLIVLSTSAKASQANLGIGLNVGSEATFGNSLTFDYRLFRNYQLNWGIGYNSTGAKVGMGNSFILNFTRSIGMRTGAAFIYSGGRDGEVEIDAEFTPEGSNKKEDLVAVKEYELSPALLLGFSAGLFWDYLSYLRLNGQLCYNLPLTGNKVTLGRKITYDKDVEVSNEDEFNAEFDREAKQVVRAGGAGFSVGAAILF